MRACEHGSLGSVKIIGRIALLGAASLSPVQISKSHLFLVTLLDIVFNLLRRAKEERVHVPAR